MDRWMKDRWMDVQMDISMDFQQTWYVQWMDVLQMDGQTDDGHFYIPHPPTSDVNKIFSRVSE